MGLILRLDISHIGLALLLSFLSDTVHFAARVRGGRPYILSALSHVDTVLGRLV